MSARVLIVEDDEAMSVALRDGFQYEGYAVTLARDGGSRPANGDGRDRSAGPHPCST